MAEATDILNQVKNIWRNLAAGQKAGVLAVTVLVFGGVLAGSLMGGRTEYRRIASGLAPGEVSALVTQLENEGISDYKILADGSTVLVSTEDIDRARTALGRTGSLPTGAKSEDGSGLFGSTAMNSREVTMASARRAEKRLAAILGDFAYVDFASVTITPAVDKPWRKGDMPAKASVVIKPRMALSEHQIQSIAHTVAAGVESLKADDVAISDTNGIILRSPMAGGASGGRSKTLQTTAEMEAQKAAAVQQKLDLAFGPHKVLVTVSLDLDWTKQNVRQRTYDPESKVTRHKTRTETSKSRPVRVPGGRPGASDTINSSEPSGASGTGADSSSMTEETSDFDLTESESVSLGGDVKRMGVGVILDESLAEKRDEISEMIKAAVNFDVSRSDTFEVTVTKIEGPTVTDVEELMQSAESNEMIMAWVEYGLYGFLGLGFLFFTLRTIKKAKVSLHEVLENSLAAEAAAVEPPTPKSLEETVIDAVKKDSELAGKSLRRWLYESASE